MLANGIYVKRCKRDDVRSEIACVHIDDVYTLVGNGEKSVYTVKQHTRQLLHLCSVLCSIAKLYLVDRAFNIYVVYV